MIERRAACSCGNLNVTVHGEPVRISICHCLACQRRTGSTFGVQARFPATAVQINGAGRQYVRIADSGNRITFHFCPDCGATVHYRIDTQPDLIAIPVGAFAEPAFPPPRFSVYESRRHDWVGLPEDLERMD